MVKHTDQWRRHLVRLAAWALGSLMTTTALAAVPGITATPTGNVMAFNLDASPANTSQPDGTQLYSWGYGCASGFVPTFLPQQWSGSSGLAATPNCPLMQVPGPTMIVPEGTTVQVTLTNNLPVAAGNTSMVFAGFAVTASGGVPGTNAQEAQPGGTVTYTFTAGKPGTYAYYSGTQADVQVEMGLYGALIVLPNPATATAAIAAGNSCTQGAYSLAASAYDNIYTCYDREYLFQLSEASLAAHIGVQQQVAACNAALAANPAASCAPVSVPTEPYRPDYFLINGRSLPDDLVGHYVASLPNQPYNGNPHMLPGENILVRVIGQGRIQHPFHIHGNHERAIARDGNLLVSQADVAAGVLPLNQRLGGPVLFTISSVSGQSIDGIFNWSGKGLNWDVYGHGQTINPATGQPFPVGASAANNGDPNPCLPDANGFDTTTHEWCADHNKPIPVTPPDPIVVANGQWYSGSPYLGLQAASPGGLPPTGVSLNSDGAYAYMWHSHDEREITTRNVFPGGLMTMLIIDPPGTNIDETQ
ncbi:MAG: multicopper oxidase domain-containing protein [Pseudomonadota bacterium]|nr:multicopper oxidase domain-containing protein [Pseudomonadota bacterium]